MDKNVEIKEPRALVPQRPAKFGHELFIYTHETPPTDQSITFYILLVIILFSQSVAHCVPLSIYLYTYIYVYLNMYIYFFFDFLDIFFLHNSGAQWLRDVYKESLQVTSFRIVQDYFDYVMTNVKSSFEMQWIRCDKCNFHVRINFSRLFMDCIQHFNFVNIFNRSLNTEIYDNWSENITFQIKYKKKKQYKFHRLNFTTFRVVDLLSKNCYFSI